MKNPQNLRLKIVAVILLFLANSLSLFAQLPESNCPDPEIHPVLLKIRDQITGQPIPFNSLIVPVLNDTFRTDQGGEVLVWVPWASKDTIEVFLNDYSSESNMLIFFNNTPIEIVARHRYYHIGESEFESKPEED